MTIGEADILLKRAGFTYKTFVPQYSYDLIVYSFRGLVACNVWRTNSASKDIDAMCRNNTRAGVERALADAQVEKVLEFCP